LQGLNRTKKEAIWAINEAQLQSTMFSTKNPCFRKKQGFERNLYL
jgi:hypothetical protein